MIRRIDIERTDQNGDPDPDGEIEVTFHDERGCIVASATMFTDGKVYAFTLVEEDDNWRVGIEATLMPGECEA